MRFLEKVEKLQEENEGYMVFVKCGIFFDVIGKDAVVLHELCGFEPICIKENTCKCGVPVKTFDKFLKKFINEHKFALVVYDYNKNLEYAEYAIGAPTLEMFIASYNQTHPNEQIYCRADEYGYYVGYESEATDMYIIRNR